MDIDIGEEWFGIANRLNLFIKKNRVMVLDPCKMCFFPSISAVQMDEFRVIKFCICIEIYKIHVLSNARYVLVNF